jgi:AcrR family transcriptional regulator
MLENNQPTTSYRKTRTRGTQERAENTREKLIITGTKLFSQQGYSAVTVRQIENEAGVRRNLLAYHFTDKENFWKTVVDNIFGVMKLEHDQRLEELSEVSERETLDFLIRFYVLFHAKNPAASRLISQEATQHSWRIQYIVDNHVRPTTKYMEELINKNHTVSHDDFIHWYYIMISSTSAMFSFAAECEVLFDVDPCEESIISRHADILVDMLLVNFFSKLE